MLELYEKFNVNKKHTFIGLFKEIKKKFNPKRVIYPGCYVHITPSLIFSDVTYIDSFKKTDKFFENEEVISFIRKNKEYAKETKINFYHQDYYDKLPEKSESFDCVISLYSGFIGQAVKEYIKKGGILVCNDSHGDASMASIDSDYELIGIFKRITDENYSISDNNLDEYLIPKKKIDKNELKKKMKGVDFTKSALGYIFRKK